MKILVHVPLFIAGVVDIEVDASGDVISTTMEKDTVVQTGHSMVLPESLLKTLPGHIDKVEITRYAQLHLLRERYYEAQAQIKKYAQEVLPQTKIGEA